MPPNRIASAYCEQDDKLWFFGGRSLISDLNDIYYFDPKVDQIMRILQGILGKFAIY